MVYNLLCGLFSCRLPSSSLILGFIMRKTLVLLTFALVALVFLVQKSPSQLRLFKKTPHYCSQEKALDETSDPTAGDPHSPAIWKFLPYYKTSKSVVQIRSQQLNKKTGHVGSSAGSGVIIRQPTIELHPTNKNFYRGYILTCDHVARKSGLIDGSMFIMFQNKIRVSQDVEVVMNSESHDVSLIRCWIPLEYKGVNISRETLKFRDTVRLCGYGGLPDIAKPRYFEAEIYRWSPSLIVVLEDAVPGDSGGGIFNEKGDLVGLISRGISSFKKHNGITITSPAHGPAQGALHMVINAFLQTKGLAADFKVEKG